MLCAASMLASCGKHEIIYYIDHDGVDGKAQFQIYYMEPIAVSTANAMDSIYINGKYAVGVGGYGQLAVRGVAPYGSTFFTAPAGDVSFQLYRGGAVVYDMTINIPSGDKYEVYVYSLAEPPIVLNHYKDYSTSSGSTSADRFGTDSTALYRLVNLLFKDGAPYTGKLQYQYSNNTDNYTDGDWHNLGSPVSFGESTDRNPAVIHKTIQNSSGYQTLRFRCLDESGNFVSGTGDYWQGYIGRAYTHILRGNIGDNEGFAPAGYTQIGNNY